MKFVCVMMMMMFFHRSSSENPRVVGPAVPLYAEHGSKVLLPCWIEPSTSALDMRVEWFRTSVVGSVVHLYKNQENINTDQIPSYIGRTGLFREELQKGNASLLLTQVQVSDDGEYTCYIKSSTWFDDITVRLLVEAVGTNPVITLESYDPSGGFGLLCESKAWFPEPELEWMGDEGVSLTEGAAEIHKDGELFSIKHRIYVPSGKSNRFYCRVKLRHHMKESEIIISDQIFSKYKAAVISVAAACVIIIIAAVFGLMVWKVKHSRKQDAKEVKRLREKDGEEVTQVLTYFKKEGDNRLEGVDLSPPQWAALSILLCNSTKDLEEFKLSRYRPSHEALEKLQLVIQSTKKAELTGCSLTDESCSVLNSVLSSDSCNLLELDLSRNDLEDSGLKKLCDGMKHPGCNLQKLGLGWCSLSGGSCSEISSVLSSGYCHLTELDLSGNNLQDSGVNILCTALKNPKCELEILRLRFCSLSGESCSVLSPVLSSGSCRLTDLDLSDNKLCDLGVRNLCTALNHPQCKLEILRLKHSWITDEGWADLAEALGLNTSLKLRELHLTYQQLKDKEGEKVEGAGLKKLRALKEDPNCQLEKLEAAPSYF